MGGFLFGGPEEIRTPDPYNANVMRSQLRYGPMHSDACCKSYYMPSGCVCQEISAVWLPVGFGRNTHEFFATFLYHFFEISD